MEELWEMLASAKSNMAATGHLHWSSVNAWPIVIILGSIYLFRGACAVKGNVQVAGHVKPAPFSRRGVTLGDVDGSLFHIKI